MSQAEQDALDAARYRALKRLERASWTDVRGGKELRVANPANPREPAVYEGVDLDHCVERLLSNPPEFGEALVETPTATLEKLRGRI